jgi:hypothetical protein
LDIPPESYYHLPNLLAAAYGDGEGRGVGRSRISEGGSLRRTQSEEDAGSKA